MSQPMPVVRQIYWPGLVPQMIAIAILATIVKLCVAAATIYQAVFAGAAIYLVLCRVLRAIFVRDHTLGIRAYKTGRFEEAIRHFQDNHQFFSAHRRLDAWRSFVFGVASHNPYRIVLLLQVGQSK